MHTLIAPTGSMLERVLDSRSRVGYDGLEPQAYRRLFAAQAKSMWGRHCQRLFAFVEGEDIIASAERYDLTGVLDGRSLRICGIRRVWTSPSRSELGDASMLVEAVFADALEQGAEMGLVISDSESDDGVESGFETIRFTDRTLTVAQSPRGAPMTTVRAGEVRDLGAIAAMGNVRAAPFRFHFERDVDFIQYVITAKRLVAGLAPANRRNLQFFIAEEGITAAAYVVLTVTGDVWTVEECGDRDPCGARVGALLQALIAREPGTPTPTIR
ncbi:MAG TPA: hypothetical protein VFP91_08345, partial [Vicinamibacterales bacterium]|nr:hypothetical protein [Vicinamibacterales bacterium]